MRKFRDRQDPDISFNPHYKEQGRTCGYEHCIETMPFSGEGLDCPVFGHDCPGGEAQLAECRRQKGPVRPLPTALSLEVPERPSATPPASWVSAGDRPKLRAALEALRAIESRLPAGPDREAVVGVCMIVEEILGRAGGDT